MSRMNRSKKTRSRTQAAGLSLIELLVAVSIGVILIFGATQMYADSRNAYSTNETTAKMQETARYALNVIEPDVRMANYWGLLKGTQSITGKAAQTAGASALTTAITTSCGTNFAVDVDTNLQGSNDTYSLACAATPAVAVATADTLTVRRASVSAPTATLRVCTTRTAGTLVNNSSACDAAPVGQISDLLVHAYYVDTQSSIPNMPSLRRYQLIAGPDFQDEEIIPGVEDLQVQFGITTNPAGTSATNYVNPNDVPAGAKILSVRVWVLVRSDTPEVGFTDTATYEYGNRVIATGTTADLNIAGNAGMAFRPSASTNNALTSVKHYRRLLVSRTVQVRNS
jgi:type IV pilus assembly protein PilW